VGLDALPVVKKEEDSCLPVRNTLKSRRHHASSVFLTIVPAQSRLTLLDMKL
jgi:hypothetical protein